MGGTSLATQRELPMLVEEDDGAAQTQPQIQADEGDDLGVLHADSDSVPHVARTAGDAASMAQKDQMSRHTNRMVNVP